jgi:hypothetical protein
MRLSWVTQTTALPFSRAIRRNSAITLWPRSKFGLAGSLTLDVVLHY